MFELTGALGRLRVRSHGLGSVAAPRRHCAGVVHPIRTPAAPVPVGPSSQAVVYEGAVIYASAQYANGRGSVANQMREVCLTAPRPLRTAPVLLPGPAVHCGVEGVP